MSGATPTSAELVDLDAGHFLSVLDRTPAQLWKLLSSAGVVKQSLGLGFRPLSGQCGVMLFEKPSLRTRVSFEVGLGKLGGQAIYLDHNSVKIGERESVADYAQNLSQWCDVIIARTFQHDTIEQLAEAATIPVINALSDLEHPCQCLADLLTIQESFGDLDRVRLSYVGEWNNVSHSLLLASAVLGLKMVHISPEGFGVPERELGRLGALAAASGASIEATDQMGAIEGSHAVYTDTWSSMGAVRPRDEIDAVFGPYQIDERALARCADDAIFMHCLPAERDREVTAAVLDGKQSAVLKQAENRMHAQNALLLEILGVETDELAAEEL